ncbi:MAG: hypothetical protein ACI89X_000079 [Planctomycetota bacterium]|jgi:hypothetical protein
MKLISIEPTPNPNSMKLNLGESLPKGMSRTYTAEEKGDCPDYIARLLNVSGVKSLFHMQDFIAIQREPRADWQPILARARQAFDEGGELPEDVAVAAQELDASFGEVRVELQDFRGVPMLVKVSAGMQMHRAALPERFARAVNRAATASPNMLAERRWVDQGARYGELTEIAKEVVEEIDSAFDDERLEELVSQALADGAAPRESKPDEEHGPILQVRELSDDPDWRVRYAALARLAPRPPNSAADIPVLTEALQDPKSSIRRLAVVYLGLTGDPAAVPALCDALDDETAAVRRTAGDALSDLADPRAIGPMAKALQDPNRLVRWRAARFLFETGDESSLAPLRAVAEDPEFEVRMQIRLAIERIESGDSGQGPIWQQMTR